MYQYIWDAETGGLLLTSEISKFSKEPRPVYSKELDILGFDRYWNYPKDDSAPLMWAEANNYIYKGRTVARTKGGSVYTAPELIILEHPEPDNGELEFVDVETMVQKNRDLLETLAQETIQKIYNIYREYKNDVDVFYVAFSGGKDSVVALDLVQRSLPHDDFLVLFGDTRMEFPDTYKVVEQIEQYCKEQGIEFFRAQSKLVPSQTWKIFGPPSTTSRWCCSVHKTSPQINLLRKITGKNDFTGMAFTGIRAEESLARSEYDSVNDGKKHSGQLSCHGILEWNSAELFLYIFTRGLIVNEAYKKGNSRAGCLLCPMSGGSSDFIRRCNYTDDIDGYIEIIKRKNNWDNHSEAELHSYVTSGGWDNRRSGRGIAGNTLKYKEKTADGVISIEIIDPHASWREWLKTANTTIIPLSITETGSGAVFEMAEKDVKAHPTAGKIIRQSLKKAAYCVGCRVCETNCKNGRIRFDNGRITITDCVQCHECHDIPGGCHAYNSLKMPQGEKKMRTINCFDDHAPKRDWLVSFFELQDEFFTEHTLGPNMFTHFKRFLRDAQLIDGNQCTDFSSLICRLGWESDTALALMLTNLAYENAQFDWYISQMDTGYYYESNTLKERLLAEDIKEKAANSVIKSFKRIAATPFGTVLNFGYVTDDGDMVRTKCSISDNRVILYALYRFAEKCNLDREFHVSYLYDDSVERDGVSPVRIFGLYDEEEFKSILLGLSSAYPDYINATFTNDLQTITLRDRTSNDVLNLFKEEL